MNERCKHIGKDGHRCGSYAFNLYKDDIDQGELCDVHYWQERALEAEALAKEKALQALHSENERLGLYKDAYQPEQEPVAWMSDQDVGFEKSEFGATPTVPLYTHPPQRIWVGPTNEEIEEIKLKAGGNVFSAIMFTNDRLEEKNT